jgi:hypothetical protein
MTPFIHGFADELTKVAGALGALKSVGKFTAKHPLLTFGAGATGIGTVLAAKKGYKSGLSGGEKARYLAASVDPRTGNAQASPVAHVNWHHLFSHKPSEKQLKRISGNYDEKKFKRG